MKIFSQHRKKIEPRRRFGGMEFRTKIKDASHYKRTFNPTGLSLKILTGGRTGVKIAKFGGIALFLLVGYYLFVSSALEVTEFTISGNHQVSNQQIEEAISGSNSRFFLIKKNNFFLLSRGRTENALKRAIPAVKALVSMDRTWPNKAKIEISEHTPGFVIESDGNFFLVDDEGVVVHQIEDPQKLLVARDQLVENFVRGETLPNPKLPLFILSMNKSWSSKINTRVAYVKFPGKSSNDVQFVTEAGWEVIFDTSRPVSVQLGSLAVILSKQIPASQQANLAYIDLRLSKWAYYCFKESPCQQKEQPDVAGSETNAE